MEQNTINSQITNIKGVIENKLGEERLLLQSTVPSILDFSNYPFDTKIVQCNCTKCSNTLNFGIYENGNYGVGKNKSVEIKTGWGHLNKYLLTEFEGKIISSLFSLGVIVNNDLNAHIIINESYNHCFILYKQCDFCNSEYILIFEPTKERYREIALKFYIHSVCNVTLSNKFKEKFAVNLH